MLNHKGEMAECTGDNIFLVTAGGLPRRRSNAGILEGITRDAVMGWPARRASKWKGA